MSLTGLRPSQLVVVGLASGVFGCLAAGAGLTLAQLMLPGPTWLKVPTAVLVAGTVAIPLGAHVGRKVATTTG